MSLPPSPMKLFFSYAVCSKDINIDRVSFNLAANALAIIL